MTPSEAAALLELAPDSTPEQIETRFLDLRTKLENKISSAPTPGLKDKYRRSLEEITTAFETLTLAADSSTLPVLKRIALPVAGAAATSVSSNQTQSGASGVSAASAHVSPAPAKKKPNANREFALVALVAVALLGGGGWFVLKIRAESAEKARLDAIAKAESEKQASLAQQKAEEEKARQEKLLADLRAKLAAARVAWETFPSELQNCERRLIELKSDSRNSKELSESQRAELSSKLEAQQDYAEWLTHFVQRNPAKTLLAKLDALTSAHAFEEAQKVADELALALVTADKDLIARKKLPALAIAREFEKIKAIRDLMLACKNEGKSTMIIPFIAKDDRIISMNQEIKVQEIFLGSLLERYTDKHPAVIAARLRLEETRRELGKAILEAESKLEATYQTVSAKFENTDKRY